MHACISDFFSQRLRVLAAGFDHESDAGRWADCFEGYENDFCFRGLGVFGAQENALILVMN